MNPFKPAKIEWLTFLLLAPVLVLVMNNLLYGDEFLKPEILRITAPWLLTFFLISWYVHITVMHLLRLKYPAYHQTYKRITLLYSSHIFLTSSSLFLMFGFFGYFHTMGYKMDYTSIKWCIVIGVLLTVIATSTWEGSYIFQLWRNSTKEKEMLQKLNLQNEFDALKSQVNPHFLFNSLNSLSSLIQEKPADAEIFLDEMSKVYRYILRSAKQELTDLSTEVKFLTSYKYLLKTRYSDGLNLSIDVPENVSQFYLPPLTLQMLVENAIKTNVVLKDRPLSINVMLDDNNRVIVKNNMQKKSGVNYSDDSKLSNIAMKYKLLNQPEIIVNETSEHFSVSIPLIN